MITRNDVATAIMHGLRDLNDGGANRDRAMQRILAVVDEHAACIAGGTAAELANMGGLTPGSAREVLALPPEPEPAGPQPVTLEPAPAPVPAARPAPARGQRARRTVGT